MEIQQWVRHGFIKIDMLGKLFIAIPFNHMATQKGQY